MGVADRRNDESARVITALVDLHARSLGGPLEASVSELMAAIAADTAVADLRQELEYLKAEIDEMHAAANRSRRA